METCTRKCFESPFWMTSTSFDQLKCTANMFRSDCRIVYQTKYLSWLPSRLKGFKCVSMVTKYSLVRRSKELERLKANQPCAIHSSVFHSSPCPFSLSFLIVKLEHHVRVTVALLTEKSTVIRYHKTRTSNIEFSDLGNLQWCIRLLTGSIFAFISHEHMRSLICTLISSTACLQKTVRIYIK